MADGGESTPQQSQKSSGEPLGLRAVLIGATGAIGECLLGELLCSKVCSMGSKSPPAFVCVILVTNFCAAVIHCVIWSIKVHVLKLFAVRIG